VGELWAIFIFLEIEKTIVWYNPTIPKVIRSSTMRTTWKPLSNETKRGDSVELSRFFVFGEGGYKLKGIEK
jgi:hypothetical protein